MTDFFNTVCNSIFWWQKTPSLPTTLNSRIEFSSGENVLWQILLLQSALPQSNSNTHNNMNPEQYLLQDLLGIILQWRSSKLMEKCCTLQAGFCNLFIVINSYFFRSFCVQMFIKLSWSWIHKLVPSISVALQNSMQSEHGVNTPKLPLP